MSVRFLHTADLHIDSRLKGLEAYEGAPVERLRNATRDALVNVVEIALSSEVQVLVIAGDLFDGEWNDMQTGLWIAAQFRRLEEAGIKVVLIRGNHDAASQVTSTLTWPGNVKELSCRKPETVEFETLGLAIHGQGFQRREVLEDLAANYPKAVPDLFNVGLLHTGLAGDPAHDPYAPTDEQTLLDRGYQYWGLGHIHLRKTIREDPFIGYSGNTQGRHIHEAGVKGCYIVDATPGEKPTVTFHPTDVVRWQLVEVELDAEDAVEELREKTVRALESAREEADGRFVAARVVATGATRLHRKTLQRDSVESLVAEIRDIANQLDEVWVEKVRFQTTDPVDLDKLRAGQDVLGELLRFVDETRGSDVARDELRQQVVDGTERVWSVLAQAGVDASDDDRWQGWLNHAEQILASRLMSTEGADS